jgi:hypothetical protein
MSLGLASAVIAFVAFSQPGEAQDIPVRRLDQIVSTDSGLLTTTMGVRLLPGGKALVNDFSRKRLFMLDSTMKNITIVADASGGAPSPYWPQGGAILPYIGDSTVFVDQASQTFTVIDPHGRIVRAMAPPRAQDVVRLMGGAAVGPPHGFDPMGRLVYRTARGGSIPGYRKLDSGVVKIDVRFDSSFIVRADLDARRVDTIAYLATPVQKIYQTGVGGGQVMGGSVTNPLPAYDEWALMPDGTIAIVRTQDYHIDWIAPDGAKSSSPKMPFDWRRVTDAEKQKMLDSARRVYDMRKAAAPPPPRPRPPADGENVFSSSSSASTVPPLFLPVELSEMPDYYPPIRPGSVKADRDGNLWIIPTTSVLAGDGLVYDVINREGKLVERVRIPAGRVIVAFGKGGLIYMVSQFAPGVQRLERAKVAR